MISHISVISVDIFLISFNEGIEAQVSGLAFIQQEFLIHLALETIWVEQFHVLCSLEVKIIEKAYFK